jgi:hypothetical protein
LLQLNFDRYDDEVKRGLHTKRTPGRGGPTKITRAAQVDAEPETLF